MQMFFIDARKIFDVNKNGLCTHEKETTATTTTIDLYELHTDRLFSYQTCLLAHRAAPNKQTLWRPYFTHDDVCFNIGICFFVASFSLFSNFFFLLPLVPFTPSEYKCDVRFGSILQNEAREKSETK